jgi:hypothetical protein
VSRAYRALISVPIHADGDEAATTAAVEYASLLKHPGSDAIAGHVEQIAEVNAGSLAPVRIVDRDPHCITQLHVSPPEKIDRFTPAVIGQWVESAQQAGIIAEGDPLGRMAVRRIAEHVVRTFPGYDVADVICEISFSLGIHAGSHGARFEAGIPA